MKWMNLVAACVAVVAAVAVAAAGVSKKGEGSPELCKMQRLCRTCIQTVGCVWCINPVPGQERCQHAASINNTASFCQNIGDLQNPQNEMWLVKDEPLIEIDEKTEKTEKTDKTGSDPSSSESIVQLRPQRIKLSLRKDMPKRLNVTYRRARDYPVDLYYLMDLSNSMLDDKKNLANMGEDLANKMTTLTDQFTLGFGSFVDKVMLPFTSTSDKNMKCTNGETGCVKPYSFRNDMKLNTDHTLFKERVSDAKISGNLDHPEGGFDALMQAMVCTESIGWREVARRILVFSTDAPFHHAGDGRLAGVVMPHDEKCHLNQDGEYTAFDEYDYPSIGQINKVAKEKNINIIFAVLGYEELYAELSSRILTSSFGKLSNGSTNVVDLIEEQYNSISSSVGLTDNATSDISIKYRSACYGDTLSVVDKCDGISAGSEVTFELEITATKCPENNKNTIVAVKTLEDTVILDIDFLCSCDCPQSNDTAKCHNGGALVCGVCDCPEGYSGEICECGGDDISGSSQGQDDNCKASDMDDKLCSGQGDCVCGVCNCHEMATGKYCQCNTRNCKGLNDLQCSGHGDCKCDKCDCDDNYSGNQCECDQNKCRKDASDKMLCSGRGECKCDKCDCTSQENATYIGTYCERCLDCASNQCKKLKDCVQCLHFNIGPRQHDCDSCQKSVAVESLDEYLTSVKKFRLCTVLDAEECYLNFTYRYQESTSTDEVYVQADRQCPEAVPILNIVFGLIGAIVGVGVLTLLIWKVCTTVHDRREYAKFEKERQNAIFDNEENPLYKAASTTTQNPMFDQQIQ